MTTTLNVEDLVDAGERVLGTSEWFTIEQARVDTFADATDDHQWIHVDPDRAEGGPYGGTIAHGYLVLSLLPVFVRDVLSLADARMGVNYGLGKVRFTAPVRVGARVRGTVRLMSGQPKAGGVLYTVAVEVEVEGEERPALVAEAMYLAYA